MAYYRELMEVIGTAVDAAGVVVIVGGALLATGRFLLRRQGEPGVPYRLYRQDLGRAILLGLEFLVAADIIRTVVVAPTLDNVVILGLIVLIRTFLSMALQLELEGYWPHRLRPREMIGCRGGLGCVTLPNGETTTIRFSAPH